MILLIMEKFQLFNFNQYKALQDQLIMKICLSQAKQLNFHLN